MNKFYTFIMFFVVVCSYSQQTSENFYVDKAWISESENWESFKYQGQLVISTTPIEGTIKISNYDFLYDFCNGRAKFSNKLAYNSATFENKRKVTSQKDKQGIVNTTYEGILIFQSGEDYYSVFAVVTLLEKGSLLGLKMHQKNSNKEYAFSLKPNS